MIQRYVQKPLEPRYEVINVGKGFYFNTELREEQSRPVTVEQPIPKAFKPNARNVVRGKVLAVLDSEWKTVEAVSLEARIGVSSARRVLNALRREGIADKIAGRRGFRNSAPSKFRRKGATC